jgi:hypothetical protein
VPKLARRGGANVFALTKPEHDCPVTLGTDSELGGVHSCGAEERLDLCEKLFWIAHGRIIVGNIQPCNVVISIATLILWNSKNCG